MRTHPAIPCLGIGIALFTAACVAAPATSSSPAAVSGPTRTGHVAPTRSDAECRPLLDSIAATPDAFEVPEPHLAALRIPPLDNVPLHLRGQTIVVRTRVNTSGAVVIDSTTFTPALGDPRYERRFRDVVAEWRFNPSVLHGCAVPSWGTTRVTLDRRL